MRFPGWTKFQDFYLRLGFLKVLVAALGSQRRSVTNDVLVERIATAVLNPARGHSELWRLVQSKIDWYDESDHRDGKPSVAEALLVRDDCPSWLVAITKGDSAVKILEWGRDLGFIGQGNQITDRALILRSFTPEEAIGRFFAGDPLAWNPFVLSDVERIFFLYHLCEIDQVTRDLILTISRYEGKGKLEARVAGELTCRTLFDVLDRVQLSLLPRDLASFRVARGLACSIATELDLTEYASRCAPSLRIRLPKPMKPRRPVLSSGRSVEKRQTTKSSDHQAIPRFEQLVDLGFLEKTVPEEERDGLKVDPRRHWWYRPTELCRRWCAVVENRPREVARWGWREFASAVVRSRFSAARVREPIAHDAATALRFLWEAYVTIRRPIGHTPLENVAITAMVRAAERGIPIELDYLHELMLGIKRGSLLPHHAYFAAGDDLDRMYIHLKAGFLEAAEAIHSLFPQWRG